MSRRTLILRILAIANAVLVTAVFAGCPARHDPSIVTIAPPPIVTIAPYGGNFQHLLPSDPPAPDPKSDKRGP